MLKLVLGVEELGLGELYLGLEKLEEMGLKRVCKIIEHFKLQVTKFKVTQQITRTMTDS